MCLWVLDADSDPWCGSAQQTVRRNGVNMKKKLAAKLCLLGLLCAAFACAVSMGIDPYNVFHWGNARDNGVEPNKNYVKSQYVIHNPDRYDTFIFGNSRVGSLDAAKVSDRCYNMYYSEGLPAEHYENLTAFLDAGVDVKTVYLGIDDVTCFVDPAIHNDQLIRRPFRAGEAGILFWADYLDPSVALRSLETICAYTGEEPGFRERLYSTGNYYLDTQLTEESLAQEEWPDYFEWYGEGAIEDIRKVKNLCEENGIELIVFVNPEFYVRWEEALTHGYLEFLRQLAQITDYYSFCGYNSITVAMENFHDVSHYKQNVGDSMIYIMRQTGAEDAGGEEELETESGSGRKAAVQEEWESLMENLRMEGFGRYVTAEDVQAYLADLAGAEFSGAGS